MESYRLIPLSGKVGTGLFVKVSPEDYEWLNAFRWHAHRISSGAFIATKNNPDSPPSILKMHRLIMCAPDGLEVDHINHETLDNRRENLRLATRQQNNFNKRGKGIQFRKGAWDAFISLDNVHVHLGRYPSELSALRARDAARLYHYGEFANVAFPEVVPTPAHEIAAAAPSLQPKSLSGYYGVRIARRGQRSYWVAQIYAQGKSRHLGYFKTAEDAAKAYDEAAKHFKGNKALLNFPQEAVLS